MIWKSVVILALLLPSVVFATTEDKQFEQAQFSESAFVLIGKAYGTNVGVIANDEGILLIDPMPGEDALHELHALIQGISSLPVSYVANTHNHEDHTGGNAFFNKQGAAILDNKLSEESGSENNQTQLLAKFGIEAIQVNSHTGHDQLYYHPESNLLFVGDVFDNSWHPTFYAGGVDGFTQSINTILATGDQNTLIVPGHGVPASKAVVKAFYKNTIEWVGHVSTLHKQNMSVEQMMKDKLANQILQRFNTEPREPFIPENAFRRFIERTISINK